MKQLDMNKTVAFPVERALVFTGSAALTVGLMDLTAVLTVGLMAHLPNCTTRTAMRSAVLPGKASPITMPRATSSARLRKSNRYEGETNMATVCVRLLLFIEDWRIMRAHTSMLDQTIKEIQRIHIKYNLISKYLPGNLLVQKVKTKA